tara:strand:- start:36 stop:260 length:225 start_codon:yes stop_codon:yes gene_type:complete
MTEQTKLLAEAIDKALEIIERNIHQKIDARFDALHTHSDLETDAAEKFTEEKIREIAIDEARDLINGSSITASD